MKFNFLFIRVIVLAFSGLLLLLTGYNGLRIFNLFNPSTTDNLIQVDLPALIPEKNISNISLIPSWHLFKSSAKSAVAARETRLNLRLIGVISSSVETQARVIIEHPSGQQKYYKSGDEIMPDVVLDAIYTDHVIINNHNSIEILQLYTQKNKNFLLKK
jgi:type II secretory pathway component PulC